MTFVFGTEPLRSEVEIGGENAFLCPRFPEGLDELRKLRGRQPHIAVLSKGLFLRMCVRVFCICLLFCVGKGKGRGGKGG